MRIAVVGAGGVGGGFGAALAKAGADVTFIARGAHLAPMKSAGRDLRLEQKKATVAMMQIEINTGSNIEGSEEFTAQVKVRWRRPWT